MTRWTDRLAKLNACSEAVDWAKGYPTFQAAWNACERGDWMLWLAGQVSGKPESASRKRLVLAACACARLSLRYVPKGEGRPRKAIVTAERWAHGKATLEEVRVAAYAAAAYYAAAADATDYAADAAAAYYAAAAAATDYAAYAAAAADAAYYAAAADYAAAAYYAAAAAAASYAADAADAARTKTLKKCADIVRRYYDRAPRLPK